MNPPSVAVVGGGPAGLMAAETLAVAGCRVVVFEQQRSVARKLLVAGRGGLNLTNDRTSEQLLAAYGAAADWLEPALRATDAAALSAWCDGLGQPTFVGTSGRVFPASFRANDLLRAWLRRLDELGVERRCRHRWIGWPDPADPRTIELVDESADHTALLHHADAVVLALGGASWPMAGSDGAWVEHLRRAGVEVRTLRPSNVAVLVRWSDHFTDRFAGVPIKNVELSCGATSTRGELMVTRSGLEGGPVYAASAAIREQLDRSGVARLQLDLAPDLSESALIDRLSRARPKDSTSTVLRRAGLHPAAAALLRECVGRPPREPAALAGLIGAVPVEVHATAGIERAISSAGGIVADEVDEHFMLRRLPGAFVAGEMLDWEAPTGGYLLQATFSTAVACARGVLTRLGS